MKKLLSIFMGLALAFGFIQTTQASDQKFVTIGTGGVTGLYYPTGGAICRLVSKNRKEHGLRCSVESTGGSIFNINAIRSGELDFGVAQSDWQYHGYNGTSKFADQGEFKELRAVFAVHAEAFTVVAREDSGVKNFADLKGKRFNIGNPGSGTRATLEVLLDEMGWSFKDFSLAAELKSSESSSALCDNNIDAYAFTAGHPNPAFKEATTTCSAKLVNVNGKAVNKLIEDNGYYAVANIPGGLYKGNDDGAQTFGVRAMILSSTNTKDDYVYEVVKSVFENFDSFKKFHPAFNHLTKEEMVTSGISIPLHEGALRYYKEVGLIK